MIGPLRDDVRQATGLSSETVLTLVGSHDTASAVVGVPAGDVPFAYIACGTWSLVGVELDHPVLTEESRAANFTNEGGVDGRIRYLRNVMGLWLLQESLRTWELEGTPEDLPAVLAAAGELPSGGPVIDPDDPSFLPPGDMPARIAAACARLDQPAPGSRVALVRCILDSLADAYGRTVRDARASPGTRSRSSTSSAAAHATRSCASSPRTPAGCRSRPGRSRRRRSATSWSRHVPAGCLPGDLEALRALVRATQEIHRYEPRTSAVRQER